MNNALMQEQQKEESSGRPGMKDVYGDLCALHCLFTLGRAKV